MCTLNSEIRQQVANPQTRPSVAVLFELPLPNPQYPCPHPGYFNNELIGLIKVWHAAGVRVLLVPDVPTPGHSTIDGTIEPLSNRGPARTPRPSRSSTPPRSCETQSGKSQWRMPCVTSAESGCAADGTVGVRFPGDGGLHFCSDPDWIAHNSICADQFAGRRAPCGRGDRCEHRRVEHTAGPGEVTTPRPRLRTPRPTAGLPSM